MLDLIDLLGVVSTSHRLQQRLAIAFEGLIVMDEGGLMLVMRF
jgi:hypothetical protein